MDHMNVFKTINDELIGHHAPVKAYFLLFSLFNIMKNIYYFNGIRFAITQKKNIHSRDILAMRGSNSNV